MSLGVLAAALAVALTTLAVYPLKSVAADISLNVVYLVAVLFIASFWGAWLGFATASVLGAQLIVEQGDDVADVDVRTAREHRTTYVFMGAPSARRGLGRLAEPVALRIVRALPDVDVRLVAQRSASG